MEKRYERASIIEKSQSVSFFTQYKLNLMQSFEILYCGGGLNLKFVFTEGSKIRKGYGILNLSSNIYWLKKR